MQYIVRLLIDAPTQAIGQAARAAAEQAVIDAGCTIQGTGIGRNPPTSRIAISRHASS